MRSLVTKRKTTSGQFRSHCLFPPHSDIALRRVIVDDEAYDLTKFQEEHPGGQKSKHLLEVLVEWAIVDPLCFSPPAGSRQGCLEAVLEIS